MNTNLLTVVKHIAAEYGEDVLGDAKRLKAFFGDLAKDEPKKERMAFGYCVEEGAYNALKSAPDATERAARKTAIAQKVNDEHGLDVALCAEALDILEAALFGETKPSPAPPQQPSPAPPQQPPAASAAPVTPAEPAATPAPSAPAKKNTRRVALIAAGAAAVIAVIAGVAVYQQQQARAEAERIEMARIEAEQAEAARREAIRAETMAGMVRISGGTFTMGSPWNEPERDVEDGPQHRVTVSTFYMGKYEVTQREWREVMGNNPSKFKGDNLPVENVSWYDAVEYYNKRSQREGLTPAYTINKTRRDPQNVAMYDEIKWLVTWNRNADGYRLPTEAEWEYACRAGTTTPFSTGNNITTSQANYDGNYPYNNNAKGAYREKTVNVGSFAPNDWGLYDMHGNVSEWCWDWFGGDYSSGAQTNPVGHATGAFRVLRGGSWDGLGARNLRSADRSFVIPSYWDDDLGFRLVRNLE
jgi:formylglycine-generating enzyme required for sulfatase activity